MIRLLAAAMTQTQAEPHLCREDSDPRFINNSADVKLRSFTTKVMSSCFHTCPGFCGQIFMQLPSDTPSVAFAVLIEMLAVSFTNANCDEAWMLAGAQGGCFGLISS